MSKINDNDKNRKKFHLISLNNITNKKDVFKIKKQVNSCIVKQSQTLKKQYF